MNTGRALWAELLGTFGIVVAPVAFSATSGAGGTLLDASLVSGLAVMVMIYAFGSISRAHFNPAVTLALAASGRFDRRHVASYIAAQMIGSLLAAGVVWLMFGNGHGVHTVRGTLGQGIGVEFLLSAALMGVILAVAAKKETPPGIPGFAVGMTVVLCVLIGGPITGGSMNPARSFGPAVFGGGDALRHYSLYLIVPIGAMLLTSKAHDLLFEGHEK